MQENHKLLSFKKYKEKLILYLQSIKDTKSFEHILRIKEEIEKCREQIQNVE